MHRQTLYFGGPILTMERPVYAQALLVREGKIQYVGGLSEAQSLAGPGVRKVNLEGRALLPAFIDAHSHLAGCANALLQAPLGECADQEEICRRLSDFVRTGAVPPGKWVRGTGYDQNTLAQGTPPDRWMLDRSCPDHPVVIQHASGHAGVFNSLALERLGVAEDAPCPEGGLMGRDAQGRLNGYMEENAFLPLLERVPMGEEGDLLRAFQTAQEQYASFGITTVQEGMLVSPLMPLYKTLIGEGKLMLDVVGYGDMAHWEEISAALAGHRGVYRDGFKLGGGKIFLDGSPQGRTAWMRAPYQGEASDYRGYPTLTDRQVEDYIRQAAGEKIQLLAHCNGDAAAEQYLRCLERVRKGEGIGLDRPVMVHAQLLDVDQMGRVKELGVIPSFFIAHVYHWGDVHMKNFGPQRAARISAAGSALDWGIPFTFHQDAPVIQPDMLETVWCAVLRQTRSGRSLGPEQRIPVLEALKAVTVNAARQYFEEGEKGSLRPGKRADLVVLDANPLETDPEALRDIRVEETMKGDRTIYCRRG